VSSCSPAEAPFLLPFSLPDGDGLEAEKAGRIASLLGEPGGSRRSEGKLKCCSSEATVRSQKEAVARWAGLGREGEAAGWDEPPPFSLGPCVQKCELFIEKNIFTFFEQLKKYIYDYI